MIYAEKTSPELGKIAPKKIAVLPIAAIEQHGDHLPVVTDTAVAEELGRRVEAKLPDLVALLPVLWCGSSHHHKGFPGTLSIRSETYVHVLMDLVECLVDTGFQRIFLLNCHGGNQTPFAEALYRLNLKYRERGAKEPWIAAASYWHLAAEEIAGQNFMHTRGLSHACEYETSMMLSLRVDWVDTKLSRGETKGIGAKYYDPSGQLRSKVSVSQSFHQISDTGALGAPEKATAQKGSKLFDLITPVIVDFLKDYSKWKRRSFARSNQKI